MRKKISVEEFRQQGHPSLDGQIVEFKEPLFVYGYEKEKKNPDGTVTIPCVPIVQSKKPVAKFMKVTGGFGSCFACIGRMIIGKFYETLKDAEEDNEISLGDYETGGNTKEFPEFVWVDNETK